MKQLQLLLPLLFFTFLLQTSFSQSLSIFDADTTDSLAMNTRFHTFDSVTQVSSNFNYKSPPFSITPLLSNIVDMTCALSCYKLDSNASYSEVPDTNPKNTSAVSSTCTNNLLTNGSFNGQKGEGNLASGWTVYWGTPDINDENGYLNTVQGYVWLGKPLPSPDGGTWQNIAGGERFSQTVNLIKGNKYTICFYYAVQGIGVSILNYNNPSGLKVQYNGTILYATDDDSTQYTWEKGCCTFTADTSKATIILSATKTENVYLGIDGVCLLPADTLTTDSVQQNITSRVIDFGKVIVGNFKDSLRAKTIFNSGDSVTFYKVFIGGGHAADFSILNGGGGPITLNKDSLALLDVRFTPTTYGSRYAELRFEYDILKPYITVPLMGFGIGKPSIISTTNNRYDITCIDSSQIRAVVIKNNGGQTIQLLRAEWNTNTNNVFSTTILPQSLAVDSSITLLVVFTPDAVGVFSAQILWIADKDTAYSTFYGVGKDCSTKINPSITSTASVGFDSVCVNTPKTLTAIIKNNGNQTMQLLRTEWITNTGNAFATTLIPQLLKVDSSVTLPVVFTPKAQGVFSAQIRWISDKDTAFTTVYGAGKVCSNNTNPSITSTASVGFDSVCANTPKTINAIIKNTGNQSMQLLRAEWITNTGNSFATTLMKQPLAVNSSISVPIVFTPKTAGTFTGEIRWIADLDTTSSIVSGIGKTCVIRPDTARTTVVIQDITAQAGEKVHLILKLNKQSGMQATGAPTDWFARIHYNNSILFNERTNNVCVSGSGDSCVLELSGMYNPTSDVLSSIPCVVTLGNTDNSTIVIDTFYWKNNTITTETQTQNGNITITGICEQGGVRLFIPVKNSTSLSTRPNPAQNSLQIQYGLREPLTVTLELLDITGQIVQTIVTNQSQGAGQYILTQDLSQLGNGVYALRLKTNKETLSTRVDVVK